MAGAFESWVKSLRVSWMGPRAQAIMGGLAAALGDRMLDWARQANLEHMPERASSTGSVALIGSERQVARGLGESQASYAARLPQWRRLARYRGRAIGILLGLYYAGYSGAVVAQQNGLLHAIFGPLPPMGPDWDPTTVLSVSDAGDLPVPLVGDDGTVIPAGKPWFVLDCDAGHTSRFAIYLPATPNIGIAVFAGTDTAVVTWPREFSSADYLTIAGSPACTGGTPVAAVDASSKTTTQATVRATAPFTGTVPVLAWSPGSNPLIGYGLSAADLRAVLDVWRPAKALPVRAVTLLRGKTWGYPVRTWADNGDWETPFLLTEEL